MTPVIPIILAAVLGFGIGYKLKECLCKKEKSSDQPDVKSIIHEFPNGTGAMQPNDTLFSLNSIKELFCRFNIPLTSDYSFSRLLDAIEKDAYVTILRHIDTNIASPDELFQYLNNEKFNVSHIEIVKSSGDPYLTQDIVNKLLEENRVDYTHLKTIEEKVEFLLILAQGKGTKRFQESFGSDLTTFINKYGKGEKTDVLFESIKTTIRNRLEFLS